MLPVRYQAITWTTDDISSIQQILNKIQIFSIQKMCIKLLSGKLTEGLILENCYITITLWISRSICNGSNHVLNREHHRVLVNGNRKPIAEIALTLTINWRAIVQVTWERRQIYWETVSGCVISTIWPEQNDQPFAMTNLTANYWMNY